MEACIWLLSLDSLFNSKLKFITSKLLAGMLAWMLYMKIFISCGAKTTYALKVVMCIYLNPRDFYSPFLNLFASSKLACPHFTFFISGLHKNEGIQLDTVLMHLKNKI